MSTKNGISAIANEVIGDVQKEAEAVISAAEKEAKQTLSAAKQQADQSFREIINQAKSKADADSRKIASVTEVEMRNRLLQTKEELVDAAFEKAVVKLKEFVTTEEYHKYLLKLIEAVAKKIGHKDLVIQLNASDKAWLTQDMLKSLSKKTHAEMRLAEKSEDFIGGCIIQTSDGKIIYDNTINNRLQQLKPTLRVEVAKILFTEE